MFSFVMCALSTWGPLKGCRYDKSLDTFAFSAWFMWQIAKKFHWWNLQPAQERTTAAKKKKKQPHNQF